MPKLKRPNGFESSDKTVFVEIGGKLHECANLLKSRIPNATIVLVANNEIWNEVDALALGCDNSNLEAFKNHVEAMNYSLTDMGIFVERKKQAPEMTLGHDVHMKIQGLYPKYSYVQIHELYKYLTKDGRHECYAGLRDYVKMCDLRGETIPDFINRLEVLKQEIINRKIPIMQNNDDDFQDEATQLPTATAAEAFDEPDDTDVRIAAIQGMGYIYDQVSGEFRKQTANGFATVSTSFLETALPEEWDEWIEGIEFSDMAPTPAEATPEAAAAIPAPPEPQEAKVMGENEQPAAPAKKPVSLETIGGLTADRISELQGLKEKQLAVVAANPFVKITDAKTLKAAKNSKAALLKASTDTEKIETNASKFLNQFKDMLKKFIEPNAKITRDAHLKQATEITRYETADALRIQNENKAKLVKIKNRTDQLFAVPMVFNGELYSIGALHILPSQIETMTDEEFAAKVAEATGIKSGLDAAESVKDEAIQKLRQALIDQNLDPDAILGIKPAATTAPAASSGGASGSGSRSASAPAQTAAAPAANPNATATANPPAPTAAKWEPAKEYTLPDPNNTPLNNFDMQHFGLINSDPIPPAFIKCRAYYAHGLADMSAAIQAIFDGTSQTKAADIKALIAITAKSA